MLINGVDYGRSKLGNTYEDSLIQNRFVSGTGKVRTTDKSVDEELITYTLPRVPYSKFVILRYFLTKVARYAANEFALVDDHGQSRTVYWWDKRLRATERAGRIFEVTITVRVKT